MPTFSPNPRSCHFRVYLTHSQISEIIRNLVNLASNLYYYLVYLMLRSKETDPPGPKLRPCSLEGEWPTVHSLGDLKALVIRVTNSHFICIFFNSRRFVGIFPLQLISVLFWYQSRGFSGRKGTLLWSCHGAHIVEFVELAHAFLLGFLFFEVCHAHITTH